MGGAQGLDQQVSLLGLKQILESGSWMESASREGILFWNQTALRGASLSLTFSMEWPSSGLWDCVGVVCLSEGWLINGMT